MFFSRKAANGGGNSGTVTTDGSHATPLVSDDDVGTSLTTAALPTETTAGDSTAILNLGEFWHEWSRCITFTHQRDHYYRYGALDDCAVQWRDYTAVLAVKFTNDATQAQRVVQQTALYQSKHAPSPTVGVIWPAKAKPSWD